MKKTKLYRCKSKNVCKNQLVEENYTVIFLFVELLIKFLSRKK